MRYLDDKSIERLKMIIPLIAFSILALGYAWFFGALHTQIIGVCLVTLAWLPFYVKQRNSIRGQLIFAISFPWLLFAWESCASSGYRELFKNKTALMAIPVLLIWQMVGSLATKKWIREDDPHGKYKWLPILIIFYFPPVVAVLFGPLSLNLLN